MATRLKKGDKVKVISGKDKGKEGEILQVNQEKNQCTVEKINIVKKHKKKTQESAGGIIEVPAPIHVSNVMLICPIEKKPVKVGYQSVDGTKKRKSKSKGNLF